MEIYVTGLRDLSDQTIRDRLDLAIRAKTLYINQSLTTYLEVCGWVLEHGQEDRQVEFEITKFHVLSSTSGAMASLDGCYQVQSKRVNGDTILFGRSESVIGFASINEAIDYVLNKINPPFIITSFFI